MQDSQILRPMLYIIGIVAFVLLVPLTAMQFTDEVQWGAEDFALAGGLLFAAFISIYLIFILAKCKLERLVFSFAVLGILVLIWLELAVGIFGSPFAGK